MGLFRTRVWVASFSFPEIDVTASGRKQSISISIIMCRSLISAQHAYLWLVAGGEGNDQGVSGSVGVYGVCSVMGLFSLSVKAFSVSLSVTCWGCLFQSRMVRGNECL